MDGGERGPGDNLDAGTLLSIITRLESLDKEKRSIAEDVKAIKAEAKAAGFTVGVITMILKERRQDPDDIEEINRELARYKHAIENVTAEDL